MAKNVSILATRFSSQIVTRMIEAATDELTKCDATLRRTVTVPGSYEIPLALQKIFALKDSDAVVILSYIERGETLHGQIMGHVVQSEIIRMSLKSNTPVGIGIIGPGATLAQAEKRWGAYARAAVRAALELIDDLQHLAPGQ